MKRDLVQWLRGCWGVSERRACATLSFSRTSFRYQSVADEQAFLRMRIKEIAAVWVSYGYLRIHTKLLREGFRINRKRVYRIYRQEGLSLRRRVPKRRVAAQRRSERPLAAGPNESWSMDFMSDQLFDGRKIRVLALVDNFSRECLALQVGQRLGGADVAALLERVCQHRDRPRSIRVDNGTEFTSKVLDLWAYSKQVKLDFSRPGRPTDNAFIESFNGRFRQECLNQEWFLSIDDARRKAEAWRQEYNEVRPHSSLGDRSPGEFMAAYRNGQGPTKPKN